MRVWRPRSRKRLACVTSYLEWGSRAPGPWPPIPCLCSLGSSNVTWGGDWQSEEKVLGASQKWKWEEGRFHIQRNAWTSPSCSFLSRWNVNLPQPSYKQATLEMSVQFSFQFSSVQSLSSVQLFSTPRTAAHQASLSITQLPELTQTQAHWVGDAIQPSHPLLSPSLPAFNLSQHQGLFQWVNSLHQVTKVLEFQLQHQSFQWIFRTDFL